MKRFLLALIAAVVLTGCAASAFKQVRANANSVRNGMTLEEAVVILGSRPTHFTNNKASWRRGNAQNYTGLATGAVEFELKDGRIVNIPEGGIFSPAAHERYKRQRQEEADRLAAEREERERREAEELAKALEDEKNALAQSIITCNDKTTCAKIFALAQIYVAQTADQKIQVATDTIIETYNPTDSGNIGISVVKTPKSGSTEVISITPNCRHKNDEQEKLCRSKRTVVYAGFRPFVESNLRQ